MIINEQSNGKDFQKFPNNFLIVLHNCINIIKSKYQYHVENSERFLGIWYDWTNIVSDK